MTPGSHDVDFNGLFDVFACRINGQGQLVFATFLGGSGYDSADVVAVNGAGQIFVGGITQSSDFPITVGAFDPQLSGPSDGFLTVLDESGSVIQGSTYLGGAAFDLIRDMHVSSSGRVTLLGDSDSPDFPTTPNAFDPSHNGAFDLFIAQLDGFGTELAYSTYVGGSDFENGFAVQADEAGHIYVVGATESDDFPTTPGSLDDTFNGTRDVVVFQLVPGAADLGFSTYLGGSDYEYGRGIQVTSGGDVVVVGQTHSMDFPTTPGAYQTGTIDTSHGFVTRIDAQGAGLVFSTYLGGASHSTGLNGLVLDDANRIYFLGDSFAMDFPVVGGASCGGLINAQTDIVFGVLSEDGSDLLYSTCMGGKGSDYGEAISMSDFGQLALVGTTFSPDFMTTPGAYDESQNGNGDAFVMLFDVCTPSVTVNPSSAQLCTGTSFELVTGALSVRPLTYQWYLNGLSISGATGDRLTLTPVSLADQGMYHCVVTSECGSVSTDPNQVTVIDRAFLVEQWRLTYLPDPSGNGLVEIDDLILALNECGPM